MTYEYNTGEFQKKITQKKSNKKIHTIWLCLYKIQEKTKLICVCVCVCVCQNRDYLGRRRRCEY